MSISRQAQLRSNQRSRTRSAIVEAAQQLAAEGAEPSVAEAARAAEVSRATAYRYFPTQEALLVELASVTPGSEPVEDVVADIARQLHPSTDEVAKNLQLLLSTFGPIVVADEERLRTALLVYQDTWLRSMRATPGATPEVREGRRMRWLDTVLEPLDLTSDNRERLRAALALTLGIDSLVIMKDVARLDDDQALTTLSWVASTLLRAAIAEAQA